MKLKKYRWIGNPFWIKFARGRFQYNLDTITDEQVAELLDQDPKYWSLKFELIPATNTKKKKEPSTEE
jgi:hypothetical protein